MQPRSALLRPARGRLSATILVALALCSVADGASADSGGALLSFLEARHRESGFSGSVLVVRGEEVVLDHSYGLADYELGVRFDADTLFRIGSITEPFTAAAVLLLEGDKKLSTSDPLCRFLEPCCPADLLRSAGTS